MTAVLHLVAGHHALDHCLDRVGPCDSVLLMSKGSITHDHCAQLTEASRAGVKLYLLEENMDTTTLPAQDPVPCLLRVDYNGFVILTERHATTVTWA